MFSLQYFAFILLLAIECITKVKSEATNICDSFHIDSIAWISDQNKYFFMSGGYYWIIAEDQMPPNLDDGKKLPHFTRGEAAVYSNTFQGCGIRGVNEVHSGQEIVVTELTTDGHMIMVYDLIRSEWKTPVLYSEDPILSHLKVDWSKSLDAMFDYNTYQIYAIQNHTYAGISFEKICVNPIGSPDSYEQQNSFIDFDSSGETIDAIFFKHGIDLYLFIGKFYYVLKINANLSGRGKFVKSWKVKAKSVAKDFFKFDCNDTTVNNKELIFRYSTDFRDIRNGENSGSKIWVTIALIILISIIFIVLVIVSIVFYRTRKQINANNCFTNTLVSNSSDCDDTLSKPSSSSTGVRLSSTKAYWKNTK